MIAAQIRRLLLASAVCLWQPNALARIDEIIVFGDSLSDVGNVNAISFGVVPNDDHYQSRSFSNGAPWIRYLAEELGVANPAYSRAGTADATNYAYGGAQSGEGGQEFFGVSIRNIAGQIDEFVEDGRSITPASLVVVWIGGNDLNGTSASDASRQILNTIRNVEDHLDELIELGATQLLIPNLPLLGEIPQHNGNSSDRAQQNTLTMDYNDALADLILTMRESNPSVRFIEFDVEALMIETLTRPEAFGLTNTTDPAYTPGFLGSTIGSSIVDDPDQYSFWDDIHPTRSVHRLLGERAVRPVLDIPLPVIERISIGEEKSVLISFQTIGWQSYVLERSMDLSTWESVVFGIAGTGDVVEVAHEGALSEDSAYYRVGHEQ